MKGGNKMMNLVKKAIGLLKPATTPVPNSLRWRFGELDSIGIADHRTRAKAQKQKIERPKIRRNWTCNKMKVIYKPDDFL